MEVARGKKFSSTRGDPPFPGSRLASRAMPITAAVIGDGTMSTAGALIDMAGQCGGATARNGQQDFDMRPADPPAARQRKATPAVRTRSASSKSGRLIYVSVCDLPFSLSESRGLAVALR